MKNQHYLFNDLYNVRDLGGYQTLDGHVSKKQKYIRGTAKGTLNEEEKERLYQLGVRVIVDLRNSHETLKQPHPLRGYKDIKYYSVDLIGSFDNMMSRGYKNIGELYRDLLEYSKEEIKEIFKIFHHHLNECIFFNCTAGKDRTGVISMLLLKLIEVSDEDIIENYEESFINLRKRYENEQIIPEMYLYTLAKAEYMKKTIIFLEAKYRSAANYLLNIGLDINEINDIKLNFIRNT